MKSNPLDFELQCISSKEIGGKLKGVVVVLFVLGLTGCFFGENFQSKHEGKYLSSNSLALDSGLSGKVLYENNCLSCHGPLENSAKRNNNALGIKTAIESNSSMSGISSLKLLSDEDIDKIAIALGGKPMGPQKIKSWADYPTCVSQSDPGHKLIHRLNKVEIQNSLRELIGLNKDVVSNIPEDGFAQNFDNNARVLALTPFAVEQLNNAISEASAQAFKTSNFWLACNISSLNKTCANQSIRNLATKAFRRPVNSDYQSIISNIIDEADSDGLGLEFATRMAMEWVLLSPSFLFRHIELTDPNDHTTVETLDSFEMAERMSFFLWSSLPDNILMEEANKDQLTTDLQIRTQVDRMLKDEKAKSLVDNFALKWVEAHKLEVHHAEPTVYNLSDDLKNDMTQETRLFFQDLFQNNKSVLEVLTADYTYANKRLGDHYGVTSPLSNEEFQKVSLKNTSRQGILGQASVLTVTSHSNRSSIVLRGKFILDNIICEPVGAAPPGTEGLPEGASTEGNIREQLQAHRARPECASCHNSIDPVGFALENFDGIGQLRTRYKDGSNVDTSAQLPDGRNIADATDLNKIFAADPQYRVCVTKKLMTYALGRELKEVDQCTVNRIARDHTGEQKGFSDLIKEIVTSDPFRKQRGEEQ